MKLFKGIFSRRSPVQGSDQIIDLEELLSLVIDEEHWFLQAHQTRVAFYTSFISAVLAATLAGTLEATKSIHFVVLMVGPAIVFVVSIIAQDGTYRFYQRFLESVTTRAKLEQALGLTRPSVDPKQAETYWSGEPLIPARYIDARISSASSYDFVQTHKHAGYHRPTRRLFIFFQALSILLLIILLLIALKVIPA